MPGIWFSSLTYLLTYPDQQALYFLLHITTVIQMFVEPYHSQQQRLTRLLRHASLYQSLVFAICLTHLAFHSVTLHRAFEAFLGHTHQNPNWRLALLTLFQAKNRTKRICRHRATGATLEERCHQRPACDPLLLVECMGTRRQHLLVIGYCCSESFSRLLSSTGTQA